jgi:hypothetical protein
MKSAAAVLATAPLSMLLFVFAAGAVDSCSTVQARCPIASTIALDNEMTRSLLLRVKSNRTPRACREMSGVDLREAGGTSEFPCTFEPANFFQSQILFLSLTASV